MCDLNFYSIPLSKQNCPRCLPMSHEKDARLKCVELMTVLS